MTRLQTLIDRKEALELELNDINAQIKRYENMELMYVATHNALNAVMPSSYAINSDNPIPIDVFPMMVRQGYYYINTSDNRLYIALETGLCDTNTFSAIMQEYTPIESEEEGVSE